MKTEKDVVYKTIADKDLKIDIYTPETTEHTRTAIILLHGGGWRHGDKSMMSLFGPELASHGFVAFAPEYRLLGESPWPAQIEDVKSAICWVKKNAEKWNLDPSKVTVEGFSAGGHLALMAGGTPDDSEYRDENHEGISDAIAAVVAFFPPSEFTTESPSITQLSASVLLGEGATLEEARKISPLYLISEKNPPTFLLHGTNDRMVSHLNSQTLYLELEKIGATVESHFYPGHTHEFARLPSMMASVQAEIALFLRRFVVNPEKYIQENLELNQFAKMK